MKLLHKGKVKEVYTFGEHQLLFHFTDQISVFDKIIPTLVPKKGETLCRTSAYWFQVAEKLGFHTHYQGMQDVDKMLVKRARILQPREITRKMGGHFIPLEVVCRHYVAGSLHDRLKTGEIQPEQVGLPAGDVPPVGTKLPEPFVEFTTKLEKVDRPLTDAEAREIAKLSDEELQNLKDTTIRIDQAIAERVEPRGLIHVDGKKEFAFTETRELMIVDTFGTADEDRWWDAKEYENGNLVDISKEFVRQHYRQTGYHEALYKARAEGRPEPDIPALPDEVTRQVTDLYVGLYERITGEKF